MARSIKIPCPEPLVSASEDTGTKKYLIHLVTPLFGGGVEAGKNDPITLIRGASIRGQLRFWWRASRGASISSVTELGKREGDIWGTSTTPSLVSIKVQNIQIGKQERCAEYEQDRNRGGVKGFPTFKPTFPEYALFPFKGDAKYGKLEEQPATVTRTASFELVVGWSTENDIEKDVEAAIWSWVNFGGLGARTRRGCGTLFCESLAPPNDKNLQAWYAQKLKENDISLSETPRDWPTLPSKLLVKPNAAEPLKAWNDVVKLLQDFRQGPEVGRNPGQSRNRPGRSRWPEADSLRRITGKGSPKHKESLTTPENAFPRAELGLPIIFHFQEKEMSDSELYPEGSQRMASPLILKPLALSQNHALPAVICLNTKPLERIRLEKVANAKVLSQKEIRRHNLATYNNSPIKDRSASGSALEAFQNFVKEKGYK